MPTKAQRIGRADKTSVRCVEGDMRCDCGSLLARLVEGGVELKCRRCKRTLVLPLEPPSQPGAQS